MTEFFVRLVSACAISKPLAAGPARACMAFLLRWGPRVVLAFQLAFGAMVARAAVEPPSGQPEFPAHLERTRRAAPAAIPRVKPYEAPSTVVVSGDGVLVGSQSVKLAADGGLAEEELFAPFDTAPEGSPALLEAPAGITAIAGRVLATDGTPLEGVIIWNGLRRTETDAQGRYLATAPEGPSVLIVDGRHARASRTIGPEQAAVVPGSTGAIDFGYYEVRVIAAAGRTTALPYPNWLTPIDHAHDVAIASPLAAPVTVTTPEVPGLELRLPAGAVLTGPDGAAVTRIGLTRIGLRRTPFPLPRNVGVPIYFTAQPGGSVISSADGSWLGAQVVYPNYHHDLPKARGTFYKYEPDGDGWSPYGTGTVTADGSQVVPDPGTRVYALAGAMFAGKAPPAKGPPPCGNPLVCPDQYAGDPIDVSTGLFVQTQTDLAVDDVLPLTVTRTYRPGDYNTHDFGVGMTLPYDMYIHSVQQYQECDLVLPDGALVHYTRVINPANPTDNAYATAVFATSVPGRFFNSRISWNGTGWNMVLRDGTLMVFGELAPLQSIQDRFGNKVTITRVGGGQNGYIAQVSSPNGRFITFTYNAAGFIAQATDNLGRTVGYAYDGLGRMSTVTDADGGITTYTWDGSNRVQSITDAKKNTFLTNTYDTNDRVQVQTFPDGTAIHFAYVLDASNNVLETDVTDSRGAVRKITFNTQHYQLTDNYAVGTPQEIDTSYTRDPATNYPLTVVDGLGRTTARTYDANGNTLTVTRLAGTASAMTTKFTYSTAYNQVLTVTDPLSHVTTITRDALDQAIAITDALTHKTTYTYNAQGQVTSVTDANSNTTTLGYDHGDLVSATDPLLRTSIYFTDVIGRRLTATGPLGDRTVMFYDAISGVHQMTDPLGHTTTANYDPDGYVASIVDARTGTTTYAYDPQGRVTTRTDPLGHVDTVQKYDGNGNPLKATDRKGQAVTKAYDPVNRLSGVTYADGSTTAYTYDAASRLTQVADSVGGTVTRVFDGLDRLMSETTAQGVVSYTYDAADRRVTMTVPGQAQVVYTYDNANRLTQITQGVAVTKFGYDNANRRTSVTLPNGIAGTYAYDKASELTGLTYKSGTTTVGTLTYGYDLAGRLTTRGGTLFQSVLPAPVAGTTYDLGNRMLSRTWAGVTVAPTWDLNGNLTNDGLRTYGWDARNRLTAIAGVAAYAYDGLGRRIANTAGAAATKAYLYDGADIVQEQVSGAPTANLLTGLGVDERFSRATTGTGAATSTFLTDALGSTVALATAGGTIATSYGYDPYGATGASGAASDSAYQYAGRENDGTGLYYNRARYYNPTWGRFISEDPIGLRGGINRYQYATTNPLRFTDPTGLAPGDKDFGLPKPFWNWYHRQYKQPGDPDLDKDGAQDLFNWWKSIGSPGRDSA